MSVLGPFLSCMRTDTDTSAPFPFPFHSLRHICIPFHPATTRDKPTNQRIRNKTVSAQECQVQVGQLSRYIGSATGLSSHNIHRHPYLCTPILSQPPRSVLISSHPFSSPPRRHHRYCNCFSITYYTHQKENHTQSMTRAGLNASKLTHQCSRTHPSYWNARHFRRLLAPFSVTMMESIT